MLTWSGTVWELMGVYCQTSTCQNKVGNVVFTGRKENFQHVKVLKKNASEHKIYSVCQEARSDCIKWREPSWFLKITESKASQLSRRSKQRQGVISGCPVASGLHVKHWQQGFIWMAIVANECAVCRSKSAWSGNKSSSATLTRQTERRSGRLMMARS